VSEETPITPEQEVLEYAERLGRSGYAGRIALHLQFSALHVMYQRPDYLRIALTIFADQIAPYGGRYYRLSNDDVIYVAREASNLELDRVVDRIRLLFSEDPLMTVQDTPQSFFTRFELDYQYAPFLARCRLLAELAEARTRENAVFEQMIVRPDMRAVSLEDVGRLENSLTLVDVSTVIRKQTVCALSAERPEPIFDETFVSINDLRTLTGLHLNPLANRWLFQYLTQTLDRHMLTYLARDDVSHQRPISLNLNIATILTPEFQRFNDSIAPRLRHTLVIEFNKLDVFADMGAFLFVRDYLRERGYRICLDGLNHLTLPYYDRKKLGCDLIKIHWSPDSLNSVHSEIIPAMQRLVKDADQARVILCHCDSEQSIIVGKTLGIVMYQGREIDRMVAQKREMPMSTN
jgi:EAL domain-containing protein (putative c-di-GMP-specific phosphodiesterase class I)